MKQKIILSRLIDKYESSKHLLEPGISKRRVMLRIDKRELPEYKYEDATTRDEFNHAARELEACELISLEWFPGRPVLSAVVLNLDKVMQCYQCLERVHPKELAELFIQTVSTQLEAVTTGWIKAWEDKVCTDAKASYTIPQFCKKDMDFLAALLKAFVLFDSLHGESITMRAFSSKCYHDTKFFEREIRDQFLRIAKTYFEEFAEACEQSDMGIREQLAYLGIYARPELYELSGDCQIKTKEGLISVGAAIPYGLGIPSTLVDNILAIDPCGIQQITFIENKTNYDEYVISEMQENELVVYHGGFLSPQKKKFFSKLAEGCPANMAVCFWADIDLGGFRMFEQLQRIFPVLLPMRMTAEDVMAHREDGLVRAQDYLEQLSQAQKQGRFPLFEKTVQSILECGVTIEQETFLT